MQEPRDGDLYAEKWLPGITPLISIQKQQNPRNSKNTFPHAQNLTALLEDLRTRQEVLWETERLPKKKVSYMINGWIFMEWYVVMCTTMLGETQACVHAGYQHWKKYEQLCILKHILNGGFWKREPHVETGQICYCPTPACDHDLHVLCKQMMEIYFLHDLLILRQTQECEKKVLL